MTLQDPWLPFGTAMEAPLEHAREWKKSTGGKVVGHLLPDVPEEIIHAAGGLPIAVEGAGTQISRALAHMPGYTCSHAMGALEMGLSGNLDVLDAMVIPYVCDTTRNLFHIWDRCFPQMANEFLRLPKRLHHPAAKIYLRAEFERLLNFVSGITGVTAGIDDLSRSCALYNRSRQLLREAYRMKNFAPAVWTHARLGLLFSSALRTPRKDHITWMEALPWDTAPDGSDRRIPIYVRGKVWDPPSILGLFDELGLVVVQDEIVTGFRAVAQDVATDDDPFQGLVDRHMALCPYPGYHLEPKRIVESLLDRVRESGAAGVVFLNPKFCEAAGFDTPDLLNSLKSNSIPSLVLETSSRGIAPAQIRLRLEAFRELMADELF